MTAATNTVRKPILRLALGFFIFFSPTLYFILLLLADKFHLQAPSPVLVASLFFLIPVAALIICERMLWLSTKPASQKTGWMLFTFLAMALQFGALLVIVVTAITAAISYAQ